ncbi:hypothetical protein AB6A40_002609 [Gnathostoma spinigerum]|uniref:Potassium channel domain-containing protein n=1 Tax=Gnathostoma spinigerum TaxID=75299 RepID=A0ABD6EHV9_9BILA
MLPSLGSRTARGAVSELARSQSHDRQPEDWNARDYKGSGSYHLNTPSYHFNIDPFRRLFAQKITRKIFDETRRSSVAVNSGQRERVQASIANALKEYEEQIDLKVPMQNTWNLSYCLSFAISTLITIGHATQTSITKSGKIGVVCYTVIGVPLFYTTVGFIVYRLFRPLLQFIGGKFYRRLFLAQAAVIFLLAWIFGVATYLSYFMIVENFWLAVYMIILASFTIQTLEYDKLEAMSSLIVLFSVTVSIGFYFLLIFIILLNPVVDFVSPKRLSKPSGAVDNKSDEEERFSVVINESGVSKLVRKHVLNDRKEADSKSAGK